jgi:hypothetical protein
MILRLIKNSIHTLAIVSSAILVGALGRCKSLYFSVLMKVILLELVKKSGVIHFLLGFVILGLTLSVVAEIVKKPLRNSLVH